MANEANPLDKFLRDAEESASFPFSEDHWQRMETRLDEEAPSKKRRFLPPWWKGAALALLGIGIGTMAWQSYRSKHNATVVKKTGPSSSSTSETNQTQTIQQPENNQSNASPNAQPNPISSNKTVSPLIETSTNQTKEEQKKQLNDAIVKTDNNLSTSTLSPIPTSHKAHKKSLKNKQAEASSGNVNKGPENEMSQAAPATLVPTVPVTAQWVQGKAMQAVDTQIQWRRPAMSEEEMIRYNPRYQANLHQYLAEKNDSVTVIRFKPVAAPAPQPMLANMVDTSLASYRLQLFLGSMLWRGFIGGPTWSPAPYIGLGFEKSISPRITMAAQVGFTYFAGLQTQNRSVSYRYKFGLDSTVYTAVHKMAFRIQWPVQFRYAINKKQALMVGAGAAWQPDGISKVTAPVQVLNGGSASSPTTPMLTKNALGYLNGIRAWDVFFQAGYQWQWNNRLAMQCLWQAGLRDMTDNKILSSNRMQRNNGLMIGLRYSFVRSK